MRIFVVFCLALLCGLPAIDCAGSDRSPESFILESQVMMQQGDFPQALVVVEDGMQVNPGEPKLYFELGEVYQALGRLRDALAAYQDAVKIHPGYSNALLEIARVSLALGDQEEAIRTFERVAEIDPTAAKPHFEIAMIYWGLGNVEAGRKALIQAYRRNPEFVIRSARLENFELDELSLQPEILDWDDRGTIFPRYEKGKPSAALPAGSPVPPVNERMAERATEKKMKIAEYGIGRAFVMSVLVLCAFFLLLWGSARIWKEKG
ncbi:MAG: tetratricopeptide repeat protein [Pseudomonadota bacterium]